MTRYFVARNFTPAFCLKTRSYDRFADIAFFFISRCCTNCFFREGRITKPFSVFLFFFKVNLAKHCNMKLICTQNRNTCLDVKNKPFDWLSKQCNNNNTLNNVGSQKQSLDSRSGLFALFFPNFCPSNCTKLVIKARKSQGGGGKQQDGTQNHRAERPAILA